MKHKHAENMMLYAQDAMETDRPWERWEFKLKEGGAWRSANDHPTWLYYCEYRRKPTTININGHEVPEPVRNPLENGTIYYIPVCRFANQLHDWYAWNGDDVDECFLNMGLIHLSEEAASKHAEALLSFTRIEK